MKKNVRALLVNGAPSSVPYRDELFFTVRALNPGPQSDSSIVPDVITPEGLGPKELADYDVVLMANVARISERVARKLEGFVEEGGGLYLALGDQVETDNYNQQLSGLLPKPLRRIKRLAERNDPDAPVKITRIGSSRRKHPVFRAFDMPGGTSLQSVGVYKYMLLNPSPPEQSTVLLSYKDGTPALLERRVDKGRVFLLTTTLDRAWTDLPVRSAFLPMIRRSILYLARRATSEGDAAHTVGEPVTIDASGLVDDRAVLRGPDEIRHVIEPQKGEISFTPERAGGWEVWTGEGEGSDNRLDDLAFSVNVPTAESDLGGLPDGALAAWTKSDAETDGGQSGGGAEANKKRVNVWPALLFAVTLALLLETIIGTRRSVLKKLGRRLTFQKDPEIDV
jgi:hypothetical protein